MTESAGPHAPKNTAPRPLALCLEDLSPHAGAYRFMQCVAVPGRVPGLRIDREGAIRWLGDQDVAIRVTKAVIKKKADPREKTGAAVPPK